MNITIGQYYPGNSLVHRLDPRVKLLGTVLYITALFLIKGFLGYLFAAACLAVVIRLTSVPPKLMFRGIRSLIFIFAFTSFLNIFFTQGETVIWSFYSVSVTLEGLLNALRMVCRLTLLVVGSSILTLATTPIQLTDAIEYTLKPLKKIRVPSHEIAMMMTIALRFIPTLLEEVDKIMKAQMARGADFDTGGLIKKAKSLVPLLVPLFISAFRRADDLATAMEARCYRGDINRTKMKAMIMKRADYSAMLIMLGFLTVSVLIEIFV